MQSLHARINCLIILNTVYVLFFFFFLGSSDQKRNDFIHRHPHFFLGNPRHHRKTKKQSQQRTPNWKLSQQRRHWTSSSLSSSSSLYHAHGPCGISNPDDASTQSCRVDITQNPCNESNGCLVQLDLLLQLCLQGVSSVQSFGRSRTKVFWTNKDS